MSNYWVLDTDYESFTSIYFCAELGDNNGQIEFGWVLTRERTPDSALVSKFLRERESVRRGTVSC